MDKSINVGSRIQEIRIKRGITQEKLAELSDLSVNFISRVERENSQNISLKNLISIADSLEVPLNAIVDTSVDIDSDNSYSSYLLYKELNKLKLEDAEQLSKDFLSIVEKFEK